MRNLRLLVLSGFMAVFVLFAASVALAQTGGPVVEPNIEVRQVSPSVQTRDDSRGALPFTGGDVTLIAAIGLLAIATGTLVVRRVRSNESS